MKKLMFLGGSAYLLPAIKAAHELGAYVITVDFLPRNLAHKYADKYINVSIIDKEAVLQVAQQEKIDGIVSFATDPGVITEAYVAEKMGLPASGPYESVCILQNKGLFREFLKDNEFDIPNFKTYNNMKDALRDDFVFPVIVKPVDSAGSKGVTRVNNRLELGSACKIAMEESRSSNIIIEQYIEKKGYSSDTDSMSINGKLVFCSFNDQCFDDNAINPYTPAGFMWPCTMPYEVQDMLRGEIQRLLRLLHMRTSLYNIETRLGINGIPYIMEVSPRAGGNCLSEVLRYSCKQDLIMASIKDKLGITLNEKDFFDPVYTGYWGEIILHSKKAGQFKGIKISEEFNRLLMKKYIWIKPGNEIFKFSGANRSIGTLIYRGKTRSEVESFQYSWPNFIAIDVK